MQRVFPAYAGMIPRNAKRNQLDTSVPRIRGDDPELITIMSILSMCSPHTRG